MFKRLKAWAKQQETSPEPYEFLPPFESSPSDPPNPPTAGWWRDPVPPPGPKKVIAQRYHDGTRWTPYVTVRTPRRWTQIFETTLPDDFR